MIMAVSDNTQSIAEQQPGSTRSYWVEKTLVSTRSDRKTGKYSLGKALWSPQTDRRGNSGIYKIMLEPKVGDIVFHLVDNEAIIGYSKIAEPVDDTFTIPQGTPWSGKPGYLIKLRDFTRLEPPIHRDWILKEKKEKAKHLLLNHKELFFTRKLTLKQGAYLTKAPIDLVNLLNEIYVEKTGRALLADLPKGGSMDKKCVD